MVMPGLGVFATFESNDAVDAVLAHFRDELTKVLRDVAGLHDE